MKTNQKQYETQPLSSEMKKPKGYRHRSSFEQALLGFMENFSFYVTFLLTMYFIMIIPEIIKFNKEINSTDDPFFYLELLFVPLGCVASYLMLKMTKHVFKAFLERNMVETKFRKETDEQRFDRLANNIHGLLYYSVFIVIAYNLIKDTDLLPRLLGGELHKNDMNSSWPKNVDWKVRAYFNLSFGHHLERLISLIAHKRHSSDFFVMNLHHFITFFLMLVCYSMRQMHLGVPVLFIHDLGEPALNLVKLVREIKGLRKYLMPVFVFMYISWLTTRIVIYTVDVLSTLKPLVSNPGPVVSQYYFAFLFQVISLHILGILDYYWVFMVSKIMYDKVTKGKEKVINEGETDDDKQKHD